MARLDISLAEWDELYELARQACNLMGELETRLINMAVDDKRDIHGEAGQLLVKLSGRVFDARAMLAADLYAPQTEWTGGDSSDPRNFTLREPNWVSMGHAWPREEVDAFKIAKAEADRQADDAVRDETA